MSSPTPFQEQLASIMEVLANAAVAEICKLVDDGYALLRLEMSQCKKENEELRRRLRRARRGRAQERVLGSHLALSLRADLESPVQPVVLMDEEDTANMSNIKKEMLEEESHTQRPIKICGQGTVEAEAHFSKTLPIFDNCALSACATEKCSDLGGSSALEVSGLEAVLMDQRHQQEGCDQSTERANSLTCEYVACERADHRRTFFIPGSSDPQTADGSCSFAPDMDSVGLSAQSEVQPVPSTDINGATSLSSLGALELTPDGVMTDTVLVKMENETSPDCLSYSQYVPQRRESENKDREEVCPGDTAEVFLSQRASRDHAPASHHNPHNTFCPDSKGFSTSERFNGHHKFSAGKKRFSCKFCRKDLKCQRHFERGDRVHAGEKSFSCRHCGKLFAQWSVLKAHVNAHAREGQFSCTQCGKSFISSRKLKKHESIHTRERPFTCVLCGKCFVCSSQLKVHHNVHTGEKPYCCTLCGRSFSHPSNLKRHQKHYHRD